MSPITATNYSHHTARGNTRWIAHAQTTDNMPLVELQGRLRMHKLQTTCREWNLRIDFECSAQKPTASAPLVWIENILCKLPRTRAPRHLHGRTQWWSLWITRVTSSMEAHSDWWLWMCVRGVATQGRIRLSVQAERLPTRQDADNGTLCCGFGSCCNWDCASRAPLVSASQPWFKPYHRALSLPLFAIESFQSLNYNSQRGNRRTFFLLNLSPYLKRCSLNM